MSINLVDEIAAEAASLPVEQQQQVLEMVKSLALRKNATRRSVFGDLEHLGVRVTNDDIEEARREIWRGYVGDDE